MIELAKARAERLSASSGSRFFAVVALPLFAIYLVTASWTLPYHMDGLTNVFTASELAEHGDVLLEDHAVLATPQYLTKIAWITPAGESVAAQYPPGAAALAVPLYALWPDEPAPIRGIHVATDLPPVEFPMPPLGPAAITAAAAAATAIGLLGLAFRELVDRRIALWAAYVAGLGTGVWSVAADLLWQHGPAMLWIAAGTLLSAHHRQWSGLAFGAAILTRPHTAIVAAGNGLLQSIQERSIKPAVQIGIGAGLGLAGLVAFNAAVFGSPSITGGYSDVFATRAARLDMLEYFGNIALALVHPFRGLLIYSWFLVLLIPGLPAAWRKAPAWVRGSAIGGLAYFLVQLKANRYSGGDSFWGYRYPLEMLAAAAPLLLLSYTEWVRHQSETIRRIFLYSVIGSIVLTAAGAVVY